MSLVVGRRHRAVLPPANLSDLSETPFGEKMALGAMVFGAASLIGGIVAFWYYTRKRTTQLGQVVNRVEAGGMKLEHHKQRDMSIEDRVKILQDITWKSIQDPRNRKLALEMTKNCPERDGLCEAKAIYREIKGRVRYTGDIAAVKQPDGSVEGVDLYQSAYRTINDMHGGDCDDQSIATATMLTLNGIQSKFRITAPKKNDDYSHIYTVAGVGPSKVDPKNWVALDTTLPGNDKFGVEVKYGRVKDFPV